MSEGNIFFSRSGIGDDLPFLLAGNCIPPIYCQQSEGEGEEGEEEEEEEKLKSKHKYYCLYLSMNSLTISTERERDEKLVAYAVSAGSLLFLHLK